MTQRLPLVLGSTGLPQQLQPSDTLPVTASILNVISAGVYDATGQLIRTLWSNRPQTLSLYSWDGLKDDGNVAATGAYTLKGLTGHVDYTWEGVVGNNNSSSIRNTAWGGTPGAAGVVACPFQVQDQIYGMAITAAGNIYFCAGYNEARVATYKVTVADPLSPSYVYYYGFGLTGAMTFCVATDGTIVYWAGSDATAQNNTGIYGTFCSDDSAVTLATFTSGSDVVLNGNTYHLINNLNTSTIAITSQGWLAGVLTFNTASPHGLTPGSRFLILGSFPPVYNGWYYAAAGTSGTTINVTTPINLGTALIPGTLLTGMITGLAVQQSAKSSASTGNLFVTRGALNRLDIVNKTTGAVVQTNLNVSQAMGCCVDAADTHLWVLQGTTAKQYLISTLAGGTVTALITISGLSQPVAINSYTGLIAIVDSGSAQQVKFFVDTTGAPTGTPTFGTAGGYATSPTVTDTKFMFNNINGITLPTSINPSGCPLSFITFEPSGAGSNPGSFWLGDPGNFRSLHVPATTANPIIERMQWIGVNYNVHLCKNDPTRLFSWLSEWTIDYTKAFNPTSGAWVLKNNWAYGSTGANDNAFFGFKGVSKLSNNRTYALVRSLVGSAPIDVVELDPTLGSGGGIRYTGVTPVDIYTNILSDGSLRTATPGTPGTSNVWTTQPFNSFVANNPTWNAPVTTATSPVLGLNDPENIPAIIGDSSVFATTSGVLVAYDGRTYGVAAQVASFTGYIVDTTLTVSTSPTGGSIAVGQIVLGGGILADTVVTAFISGVGGTGTYLLNHSQTIASVGSPEAMTTAQTQIGWHLGGINQATNQWAFRTAPSTAYSFGTPTITHYQQFPQDGYFDIGHSVINAAGCCLVAGAHVLYQYYGENWVGLNAGAEVNEWYHYHESGLLAGQFGVVQDAAINSSVVHSNANGQAGIAGNAFSAAFQIVNVGGVNIGYVYHNDEGFKCGVHCWKIIDLDTLTLHNIGVWWDSSTFVIPVNDPQDLLAGLPTNATLVNGTAGWTRNPISEINDNSFSHYWAVTTNTTEYNPHISPDLNIYFTSDGVGGNPVDASVTRTLAYIYSQNWQFEAVVQIGNIITAGASYVNIELADTGGLIFIQLVVATSTIKINGTTFVDGGGNSQVLKNIISSPQRLIIETAGYSGFNVTYAGVTHPLLPVDANANPISPGTLSVKIHFASGNFSNPQSVNLRNMTIRSSA